MSGGRQRKAVPKIGRQTPTASVTLPYETTLGAEAVDLYNSTGRTARPWQELEIYDIMAVREDGLWTHPVYGIEVPRRNGKGEIITMREMLGIKRGEQILHTAHRVTTSHAAWERLDALLNAAGILHESTKQMGLETIFIPGAGRVNFRTRSAKGGLGEGYDTLIIDEAQEYTIDQESALKYVVSDSKNPQTIMFGTPPTAVSAGTVFEKLRESALGGTSTDTGWAEWSVERQTDPHDTDAWYETNPSLGIQLTERAIRNEITSDPLDFNIQRLGLWVAYNQASAITLREWQDLQLNALPALRGKLCAGVKFGKDGKHAALAIAVKTADGRILIEGIDCRSRRGGNAWLVDWLKKLQTSKIIVDGAAGQQLLAEELKAARVKKPVFPTVADVIAANAAFEQAIYDSRVCHMGQPSLEAVAANCEKRAIGSSGGFGYRALNENAEIALLDAAILAFWACDHQKEAKKQRVSY